jgi:hypothetical protein
MHALSLPATGDASFLPRASRAWIWGFSLAFIVHDGEEVIATLRAGELKSFGAPLTISQGLAAILFELGLFWLISVLAVWSGRRGWPMRVFGLLLAGYTLHGFVHLAAALVSNGYVFGAITALPAVIVYGCLALYRLHADGLLTRREVAASFAASAVLGPPFLYLVHTIGRVIG